MINFQKSVLIVSHPDDECIFASSILDKVSALIICFNKIPGEINLSQSRNEAISNYPFNKIKLINLNITQAKKSLLPINWLNIRDCKSGIKGGYHPKFYNKNYKILLKKLIEYIPKNSEIITHNPWGEYGHAEHCQVFKACFEISLLTNSKLFVSGYVSNLSNSYAKKKFYLFSKEFYTYKTNKDIYYVLYNHYLKYKCWTWYHNYSIPSKESFLRVDLKQNPNLYKKSLLIQFPLNMIKHINPFLFYLKGILRPFIPLIFKRVYRLIKR